MAKRRKKASAATKTRLKALRRKHGLGEFMRTRAGAKPNRARTSHRSNKMAKRKRSSVRRTLTGGLQRPLVAGITYALVQPFLSQFLSRFNIGIQDELVQILAAVVLKNTMKNQIVSNWANAAIIINTASLARGFSSKLLSGTGIVSTTNTTSTSSPFPPV